MSVFSQWCHAAHHHFSLNGSTLRLGQVQEVMAAGLGHRTYASFNAHDLTRLDEAAYALISVEAMVQRASDLGSVLNPKLCQDIVAELRIRPTADKWAREVVVGENMDWAIRRSLQSAPPEEGLRLALEINATFDGLTVLTADPLLPVDLTGDEWCWSVNCTAHASRDQEFFDLPVRADVRFPRIGKRLVLLPVVVGLQRDPDDRWQEYDPAEEVFEFGGLSDSDL